MTRLRDERGLTLVEMIVAVGLTLLVFGLVLTSLDVFQRNNTTDHLRQEAQDKARSAIDRLTGELRNVAAPSKGAAGALEEASAYSLVFQSVSSSQVFGGENKSNQMRVRYCLNASTPTNETLWREAQTWTTSTAPVAPSTAQCPSAAPAWSIKSQLVSNVTNEMGQSRPLFYYDSGELAKIKSVEADIFINVKPASAHPGETELKDGVLLRNSLGPPVARFTVTVVGNHQVLLNGSASSDPNGQPLIYQWYMDGAALSGGTSQQYESGEIKPTGSHTFKLKVTDTAGLSAESAEQAATVT
jgi:type II secretory pathway pseudopilin PulG